MFPIWIRQDQGIGRGPRPGRWSRSRSRTDSRPRRQNGRGQGQRQGCARRSLGEEDAWLAETSRWNPVGRTCPETPSQRPEASLARRRATADVKRRQRAQRLCDRAPKIDPSSRPALSLKRRQHRGLRHGEEPRLGRGQRTQQRRMGFPRNLGGPHVPLSNPGGPPVIRSRPSAERSPPSRSEEASAGVEPGTRGTTEVARERVEVGAPR
jgi:hypothetical protein